MLPGKVRYVLREFPLANIHARATKASQGALCAGEVGGEAKYWEMHDALFASGIRQCIDLTYAVAAGQSIWEYAPQSRAAADYTALLDRITASGDDSPQSFYGQVEKAQTVV